MKRPEIKLRGHHLICLHFFKGEGYSPQFVENLIEILRRVESGEMIRICPGADDVCEICPHLKDEECFYGNDSQAGIKSMDKTALALLRINLGEVVKWQSIGEKIPAVFGEWAAKYCACCDWKRVCEKLPSFRRMFGDHIG